MLHATAILFCDHCDAASARFERGWRARLVHDRESRASVSVACPACSEAILGEDEAAWSD